MIPFALISILELLGLISGDIVLIPAAVALAIALRFSYLIARRALGVQVDAAIGSRRWTCW